MTALDLRTVPVRSRAASAAPRGRSLVSYLLIPRPKDLVKAIVLPLAFVVGALCTGGVDAQQAGRAALVWGVLELLVYQARYQWNDIRGFASDVAHPDAAARGRLPGTLETASASIGASLTVLALRMAATVAVALVVPSLLTLLLGMTLGVFGVAVIYERLRSAATGTSEGNGAIALRPALVGLWVMVGAGYAVRGMTGLVLAVDVGASPWLIASAVVAMWALGVVFVTCRWALESMPFAEVKDGQVSWRAKAGQAREHLLGLVRFLPRQLPDHIATPAHWRALSGRTPLLAPWNLALLVAAGAAALVGHQLTASSASRTATLLLGLVLAVPAIVWPGLRRAAVAAGGALLMAHGAHAVGLEVGAASALPWVLTLGLYCVFTHQCAAEIGHPLHRLRRRSAL